jgi:ribosomal protein S18 acetylase RimI-like enzyme
MTALTLARPDDLDRLAQLVAAFHEEAGITQDDTTRRAALTPLLEGSPHGVAYLIGPARAPIGYVILSFGWSVRAAGLDAMVDELYIRRAVRGRGIGSEVMVALPKALSGAGLRSLHLQVRRDDEKARRLYEKLRFSPCEDHVMMTREM